MDAQLAAYVALVAERPELFVNPSGGPIGILLDPAEIAAVTASLVSGR